MPFQRCGLLLRQVQDFRRRREIFQERPAFFRIAGFAYGVPDGKKSMFLCMLGAMLSITCLADNRFLGQQVMFFAIALMLTMYNWIMLANLTSVPKDVSSAKEEDDEEEEIVEPV